jgi:hypothetical protein
MPIFYPLSKIQETVHSLKGERVKLPFHDGLITCLYSRFIWPGWR